MTRLYTYIVRVDDGAAPNPFGGVCSLAICKPKIRSSAKKGDWVVGTGARGSGLSGHMVYAMKVAEVLSLEKYDERAATEWPSKIPDIKSQDLARRLGDCVYQYIGAQVSQRPGVHGPENMQTDLGGRNVLLATEFYYFGGLAIRLPPSLQAICAVTQGHRSTKNEPYVDEFVDWLHGMRLSSGQLYGWPGAIVDWSSVQECGGCLPRARDNEDEC